MTNFPLRNLGAGEQWGRTVQDELQSLDRDIAQLRNSQALTDSTQNTQLASLIYKQQQLQAQQDSIVAAQATLEQQQIDLTSAQATLQTTQDTLAAQPPNRFAAQQRLSQSALGIPRTTTFTKSGGATNGSTIVYEATFTKPSWASVALINIVHTQVSGTYTPVSGSAYDASVIGFIYADSSPISNTQNLGWWKEVWEAYVLGGGSVYPAALAVAVTGSTLYVKQRVGYSEVQSASITVPQVITIQWI